MESNNIRPNHVHIIKALFLPHTHTKPARIKLISERFKKSWFISFNDSTFSNTLDIAIEYLKMQGFDITGFMEGLKYYYIVTTTFAIKKEYFKCFFIGREIGAIGISYPICYTIHALTIDKVIPELYTKFECITDLKINGHSINSLNKAS